jgi:glucosamine--fructose-6-phosphate aminotransferase (isomerizing)
MLHIEREIAEQPAIIGNLLDRESETAKEIAKAIRNFDPVFIHIAARGTSDNAARYAQYAFGIHAHLPVALATPSIHTLYETSPKLSRALVIGISQSGESEDVCKVLIDARKQGALTVAITNAPGSPLAQAAQYHLNVMTGPELSVAATKTYTAQLTAIAMLMTSVVDQPELNEQLEMLPDFIADTLSQSDSIAEWAQRYRYMERLVTIGRGYNYCTAFEISLKIKELCYISGEGYSEADFRHGPFALIDPGFPVIVVAPSGKTLPTLTDFVSKLAERQAETLIISNEKSLALQGQKMMTLPASLPEWLSPIAAVIPGQIFAMRLAIEKGHVVDAPRGLNKVTVTR